MSGEDVTLRLQLLDEFSKTTAKFNSELKKIESQSANSSKLIQHNFRGVNEQLKALSDVGVPGVGRLTGAFDAAAGAGKAFGLSSTAATVAIAGAAAGAAALAVVMVKAVAAASEGEQAMTRLTAALKAQGLYSEGAVKNIKAWADALLRTKGVNDELAATLVAQGVTMGLSVEKSQKFISLAADMAPIVGSVAGAFDALSRAAQGDERAMMSLGKQFGISKTAGLDFGQMIDEIARKTSGNAVAAMNTFSGQWRLLSEQVENFLETAGTPLLENLTDVARILNSTASSVQKMGEEIERLNGPKMKEMLALTALLMGQPSIAAGLMTSSMADMQGKIARSPSELQSGHGYVAGLDTVASHGAPGKVLRGIPDNGLSGNFENFLEHNKQVERDAADAERDRLEAVKDRLRMEEDTLAESRRELEAMDQAHADNAEMINDLLLKNYRDREAAAIELRNVENDLAIEAIRADEKRQAEAQSKLTGGAVYGPRAPIAADLLGRTAYTIRQAEYQFQREKLNAILDDKNRLDEHSQAKADLHELELEAIDEQMQFAMQLTRGISHIARGETGEGVSILGSTIGSLSTMQGVPTEYSGMLQTVGTGAQVVGGVITAMEADALGQAIGSVIGGVVGAIIGAETVVGVLGGTGIGSAVGGAIGSLFDKAPTERGKAEDTVGAMMKDWQEKYEQQWKKDRDYAMQSSSSGVPIYGDASQSYPRKDWDNAGVRDSTASGLGIAQAWSELLGGPAATGNKLLGWLDDLGMSLTDATVAVAGMVESAQGLSDFEALKVTAEASFTQTGTILTREEAIGQVELYQQGVDGMARRQQIKDEMIALALDKNFKNSVELQDRFLALNKENVALAPFTEKTAIYTEDSATTLRAMYSVMTGGAELGPVTGEPELHSGQFPSFHAVVRRDELVAPPEKFGEATEYLAARGYSSGGGGRSITIIVNGAVGDHRDIARKLRQEMAYAENRRDVAA